MEMEKVGVSHPAPVRLCCGAWRCAVSRSISCCVLRAVRERLQAAWRQCANHGSIGDLRPMALLGCPRGNTVARETHCLTSPGILTLEPVRSAAGRSHASVKLARSFGAERLGCLWLQLLGVEAFSFLPNAQGNGGGSCAPASSAPSPAACLWPAGLHRTHGKGPWRALAVVAALLNRFF